MKENKLILIPKTERYIQYMIETIIKLPRTEKFNIGTEYKTSMYKMLNKILYLSKINNNKSIVKIRAYNDIADYIYSKLKKGDIICVSGDLNSSGEIVVKQLFF